MLLSELLVRSREALGLSQKEVAARLGVDKSTVCNWEKGANRPATDRWEAIAKLLRIDFMRFVKLATKNK